ncbi:hypothetical protein LINPERPRIM_LOCUS41633, partial [Linum perenne]
RRSSSVSRLISDELSAGDGKITMLKEDVRYAPVDYAEEKNFDIQSRRI